MSGHDELIERARAALEGITPGPWRGLPHTGTVMGPIRPVASDVDRPGNRDFIAAAPSLVADLVAALESATTATPGPGIPRNAVMALLLAAEDAMLPCPFSDHPSGDQCGPCRAIANVRALLATTATPGDDTGRAVAAKPSGDWDRLLAWAADDNDSRGVKVNVYAEDRYWYQDDTHAPDAWLFTVEATEYETFPNRSGQGDEGAYAGSKRMVMADAASLDEAAYLVLAELGAATSMGDAVPAGTAADIDFCEDCGHEYDEPCPRHKGVRHG